MGTLVQMPRNPIDQVNDQVKLFQLTENEERDFYLIKESDQVKLPSTNKMSVMMLVFVPH